MHCVHSQPLLDRPTICDRIRLPRATPGGVPCRRRPRRHRSSTPAVAGVSLAARIVGSHDTDCEPSVTGRRERTPGESSPRSTPQLMGHLHRRGPGWQGVSNLRGTDTYSFHVLPRSLRMPVACRARFASFHLSGSFAEATGHQSRGWAAWRASREKSTWAGRITPNQPWAFLKETRYAATGSGDVLYLALFPRGKDCGSGTSGGHWACQNLAANRHYLESNPHHSGGVPSDDPAGDAHRAPRRWRVRIPQGPQPSN
jgi:hypothetical protein